MPIYETLWGKLCPDCEGPVQIRYYYEHYEFWGAPVSRPCNDLVCSWCGQELSEDELLDEDDLWEGDEEDEDD